MTNKLRREMNQWHGFALMIGGMVGAGIFVVTGEAGAQGGPAVPLGYITLFPILLASALSYLIFLSTPLGSSPGGAYIHISRTFRSYYVGFIFMWFQFIAGVEQKYMWHFWGEKNTLTQPFKVLGMSKESNKRITVFEKNNSFLSPHLGADHHIPSTLVLPSAGKWRLEAYFGEELYGSVIINVEEQREDLGEVNQDDHSAIQAKDIKKYPRSLYKKASVDLDEDGEEEIIELYVNASKMENGVFAWDDGQTWLLVVKDGEKSYPLFDHFVQLGGVDFSITTFDGKPGIVMVMTWQFDKTVQKFTFDHDKNGFVKQTFYKKENFLQQYNQPASYAFFEDAYELVEQAFTERTVPVLKASESDFQDQLDRFEIIYPVSADLGRAQRLFKTVHELNPDLHISFDHALDFLNEMERNPPTSEHMKQLRSIHELFKETKIEDVIIEKTNEIHPDVKELFHKVNSILNGKK